MRTLLLLSVCLAIGACNDRTRTEQPVAVSAATAAPTSPADPPLDLSSPDRALKSYWAVVDSTYAEMARSRPEASVKAAAEAIIRKRDSVVVPALKMKDLPLVPETFERDILEVKVESESRAVIVTRIRNITPIPAGAELTKHAEEARREGDRYRYVLEREPSGWKVAEVWTWGGYPAKDWQKSRPDDGKPRVPYMTYSGI